MEAYVAVWATLLCVLGIGADDDCRVGRLLQTLREAESNVRAMAILELGELGPKAARAIPELIAILEGDDEELSLCAKQTLALIGRPAVAALERVARNRAVTRKGRCLAVLALGVIGGPPSDTLVEALHDDDDQVRASAAAALGRAGTCQTTNALVAAAKDRCTEVRQRVAESLGTNGSRPDLAVPALVVLLSDTDEWTRMYAAESLGRFGCDAAQAATALARATQDPFEVVQVAACRTLSRIANDSESLQALIACLGDEKWPVREAAAEAVAHIGQRAATAVPALTRMVGGDEPSEFVRWRAISALGAIGIPAASALPSLREAAARDSDGNVREEAQKAIARLMAVIAPQQTASCCCNAESRRAFCGRGRFRCWHRR